MLEDSKYQEVQDLLNQICWANLKFFEENSRWLEGGENNKHLSLIFVLEETEELRIAQVSTYKAHIGSATCRYISNLEIQGRVNRLIKPLLKDQLSLFTKPTIKGQVRFLNDTFVIEKAPNAHLVYKAISNMKQLDNKTLKTAA